MKKYLTLGVIAIAAFALAGCGMNSKKNTDVIVTPVSGGTEAKTTAAGGVPIPQRQKPMPATSGTTTKTTTSTPTPAPEQKTITIQNFKYSPATLTVKAGTIVTWKNLDNMNHTITAENGSFSEAVAYGKSVSYTFTKPGTYNYKCTLHPTMVGKIIVK